MDFAFDVKLNSYLVNKWFQIQTVSILYPCFKVHTSSFCNLSSYITHINKSEMI